MYHWTLLVVVAGVLSVTAGHPRHGDEPTNPPPILKQGTIKWQWNNCYRGTVPAVTKDSISIRSPGWEERRYSQLADGTTQEERTIFPPQPPKRFRLSPALAAGGLPRYVPTEPNGPMPAAWPYEYLNVIADVRVGDEVEIEYSRWDQCEAFRILRRPGGRIPPVRGEPTDIRPRYHERTNAYNDWLERGIPIPDHLHPGGNQTGIAPMPRLAKPKIPLAD